MILDLNELHMYELVRSSSQNAHNSNMNNYNIVKACKSLAGKPRSCTTFQK